MPSTATITAAHNLMRLGQSDRQGHIHLDAPYLDGSYE